MAAIEFLGEQFEVPEKINERRLLKLAKYASSGADSNNLAAMGALDDLLDQCLRLEDQKRFDDLCDREGVSTVQLFEFTAKVIGAIGARPTVPSSVSSPGPSSTPASSESRRVEQVTERFPGRPDLQIAVLGDEAWTRTQTG